MIAAVQYVGLIVAIYTSWRFLATLDEQGKLWTKISAFGALILTVLLAVQLVLIGSASSEPGDRLGQLLEQPRTSTRAERAEPPSSTPPLRQEQLTVGRRIADVGPDKIDTLSLARTTTVFLAPNRNAATLTFDAGRAVTVMEWKDSDEGRWYRVRSQGSENYWLSPDTRVF